MDLSIKVQRLLGWLLISAAFVTGQDFVRVPAAFESSKVLQNSHLGDISGPWGVDEYDRGLEDQRALLTSTSTTAVPFCADPDNLGEVCNIALGCGCRLPNTPCMTAELEICEEDLTEGQVPFEAPQCTSSSSEGDPCSPPPEEVATGCVAQGLAGACFVEEGPPMCVTAQAYSEEKGCVSDLCHCDGNDCSCFWGTCFHPDYLSFTCACELDTDCDQNGGEICCPTRKVCEVPVSAGACGDPHMTGFRGQKFDFIGEDGEWYCVLEDGPALQLNMRVTSPVPSVPEITYITGISVRLEDKDGMNHTIVIEVTDPHNLGSSCRKDLSPCLADGALSVQVDGSEVLMSPGTVSVGPGVAISAVNLPGACRSFGFEKYWENKKLEYDEVGRRLDIGGQIQDLAEWILGDPTATNMDECVEYVARATAAGGLGLFAHESEHASFQITTPLGPVRLSHGRLHQLSMRDPSDQFDLPDHLTWQMNLAIDHSNVSPDAAGILGETRVPTVDGNGNEIMQGMEVIRGSQEDYRVGGPLESNFAQKKRPE